MAWHPNCRPSKNGRKGRRTRISGIRCILLSLYFIINTTFSIAAAQSVKADFLILENPTALFILNKYEQRISFQEEKLFLPFCAFQIMNRNEILSDNFTTAFKVLINYKQYFLLTDEKQKLINLNQAGYYQFFENGKVLNDTIDITQSNVIYLESPDPTNKKKRYLEKGVSVRRIFQKNNKYYVQLLNLDKSLGWANLEHDKYWRLTEKRMVYSTTTPSQVVQKIRNILQRTNRILESLFQYFNRNTNQQLPIVQWQMEIIDNKILCTLSEPYSLEQLTESTQYLINELDTTLMGTGLSLELKKGHIEIAK